jgi:hypothetical protein
MNFKEHETCKRSKMQTRERRKKRIIREKGTITDKL